VFQGLNGVRERARKNKQERFTALLHSGIPAYLCGEQSGAVEIRRITDGDRRRKKLQAVKQEIRRGMHDPVEQTGGWLKSVLNGYYQYHAVPGNLTVLKRFRRQVARYWFRALGQRSQRRPTWENLGKLFDTGYPFHILFMTIPARVSAPAAFRRHIQSKNRVR
jgi:hypothetical protein